MGFGAIQAMSRPSPPRGAMVAVVRSVEVSPPRSVTVRVTSKTPPFAKEWVAVAPVAVAPSPNTHAYVSASPSGSMDAAPWNSIGTPRRPEYGPPERAVGAWFAESVGSTTMWVVSETSGGIHQFHVSGSCAVKIAL